MTEYIAFGTILAFGNGETPSEEYTLVANVKDISGPSMTKATVDVTNHQSPDRWAQYLGSIKDGGEITFDVDLDPGDATHDGATGLVAIFDEDDPRNWRLILPVESSTPGEYEGFQFPALVTGFNPAEPVKEALKASITMKVTGKVVMGHYPIANLC